MVVNFAPSKIVKQRLDILSPKINCIPNILGFLTVVEQNKYNSLLAYTVSRKIYDDYLPLPKKF